MINSHKRIHFFLPIDPRKTRLPLNLGPTGPPIPFIILLYRYPIASLSCLPNPPLLSIPGLHARTTLDWMDRMRERQAMIVISSPMNHRVLENVRMGLHLKAAALRRPFPVPPHLPSLPPILPLPLFLPLCPLLPLRPLTPSPDPNLDPLVEPKNLSALSNTPSSQNRNSPPPNQPIIVVVNNSMATFLEILTSNIARPTGMQMVGPHAQLQAATTGCVWNGWQTIEDIIHRIQRTRKFGSAQRNSNKC